MKTSRILILSLSVMLLVTGAFAATTTATKAAPAKAPAPHGHSVHGTVARLNDSAKTFEIKTGAKKSYDLEWNDATKVSGGTLKDGEAATVKYMVRDGKNVATSIMITKKG